MCRQFPVNHLVGTYKRARNGISEIIPSRGLRLKRPKYSTYTLMSVLFSLADSAGSRPALIKGIIFVREALRYFVEQTQKNNLGRLAPQQLFRVK